MINRLSAVFFLVIFCTSLPLFASADNHTETRFCSWFGWAVRPIGICTQPLVVSPVVNDVTVNEVKDNSDQTPPATTIITYATTTQPIIQEITNEYVTVQGNGLSESYLTNRLAEILTYIDQSSMVVPTQPSDNTTYMLELARLEKKIARQSENDSDTGADNINDLRDELTLGADFTDSNFTNPNFSNASFASAIASNFILGDNWLSGDGDDEGIYIDAGGNVGIGTTTPPELLSLAGAMYLSDTTPGVATNRLYNNAGSLYWNGSVVTSSTTGNWSSNGSDVYRLTGNVGIGTTSPQFELDVNGTARVDGSFRINTPDTQVRFYENSDFEDWFRIRPDTGNGIVINSSGDVVGLAINRNNDRLSIGTTTQAAKLAIQSRASDITILSLIETGGQEVFTVLENGNVGIGTTTPSAKLELFSNTATIQKFARNTNVYGFEIGFGAEFGLYDYINSNYAWNYVDDDLLLVPTSGNVGIGTTSPINKFTLYDDDTVGSVTTIASFESANQGAAVTIKGQTNAALYLTEYDDGANNTGAIVFNEEAFSLNYPLGITDGSPDSLLEISASGGADDLFMLSSDDGNDGDLFIVKNSGNVGIGTDSPNSKLHIEAPTTPALTISNTDAALTTGEDLGAIEFYSNDATVGMDGVWGQLRFEANASWDATVDDGANFLISTKRYGDGSLTDRFIITASNGYVGIGTTTPNRKLHVDSSGNYVAALEGATNARVELITDTAAAGQINFGAIDDDFAIYTGGSQRLIVDESGNVGIGSSSPKSALHVESDNGSTVGVARFTNGNYVDAVQGSGLLVGFGANTGDTYTTLQALDQGFASTNDLIIQNSGGNVGIGTTSPDYKLHINSGGSDLPLLLESSDSGSYIGFKDDSTTDAFSVYMGAIGDDLRILTGGADAMRIDSSGNVGIGNTSPSELLHVGANDGTTDRFMEVQTAGTYKSGLKLLGGTLNAWHVQHDDSLNVMQFGMDASEFVTIDSSGNVGIGTTTPSANLTLADSATTNFQIDYTDNTSFGLIEFSESNTAMGYIQYLGSNFAIANRQNALEIVNTTNGNGPINFFTGGDEAMRITASGNVGIGTTTPSSLLHVYNGASGNTTVNGNADDLIVENSTNAGISILAPDNNNSNLYFGSPTDSTGATLTWNLNSDLFIVGTNNGGAEMSLVTGNNSEAMRIDENGNVGIGDTTPDYEFEVNDSFYADSATAEAGLQSYNAGNDSAGPEFQIGRNTSSGPEGSAPGTLNMLSANGTSNYFWVDGGGADLLRIHTAAPTGDGEGSPTVSDGAGTVVGSQSSWYALKTNIATVTPSVRESALSNILNSDMYTYTLNGSDYTGYVIYEDDRGGWFSEYDDDSQSIPALNERNLFGNLTLAIQTMNTVVDLSTASTTQTALTVDESGNVGIGTASPTQALTVSGTIQATNLLGGATTLSTDASGNIIRTPSDANLKENVTTIDNALEKLLALEGVTYDWVDEARFGDQTEIGFIAQDVELILPEVVRQGGEYWSLNTPNMLAVVIEGFKEMWAVVTGNRDKIETLEGRIEVLEAALDIESSVGNTLSDSAGGSSGGADDSADELSEEVSGGNEQGQDSNQSNTDTTSVGVATSTDPVEEEIEETEETETVDSTEEGIQEDSLEEVQEEMEDGSVDEELLVEEAETIPTDLPTDEPSADGE